MATDIMAASTTKLTHSIYFAPSSLGAGEQGRFVLHHDVLAFGKVDPPVHRVPHRHEHLVRVVAVAGWISCGILGAPGGHQNVRGHKGGECVCEIAFAYVNTHMYSQHFVKAPEAFCEKMLASTANIAPSSTNLLELEEGEAVDSVDSVDESTGLLRDGSNLQRYLTTSLSRLLDVRVQKWTLFSHAWNEIVGLFREEVS